MNRRGRHSDQASGDLQEPPTSEQAERDGHGDGRQRLARDHRHQAPTVNSLERHHAQQWSVVMGISRRTEHHGAGSENHRDQRRRGQDHQGDDRQRVSGQRRLPGRTTVDLYRPETPFAQPLGELSFVISGVGSEPLLVRSTEAWLQQIERLLKRRDIGDRKPCARSRKPAGYRDGVQAQCSTTGFGEDHAVDSGACRDCFGSSGQCRIGTDL